MVELACVLPGPIAEEARKARVLEMSQHEIRRLKSQHRAHSTPDHVATSDRLGIGAGPHLSRPSSISSTMSSFLRNLRSWVTMIKARFHSRWRSLDRRIDQDRAGRIEPHDREFLQSQLESLPDLLGRTVGVGVVAGDRRADDRVWLSLIRLIEHPPSPLRGGEDRPRDRRALEPGVLADVMPLDGNHVEEAIEGLVLRLREERGTPAPGW